MLLLFSLLVFFVCFLAYCWIPFRLFLLHPISSVYNALIDFVLFFVHRKFDYFEAGKLQAFIAPFGGGKTLTMAVFLNRIYKRFNNRKVWDRDRHKFVTQKIHIMSNFELKTIPFEVLHDLTQVVNYTNTQKAVDLECDTRTCCIVAIDEASVQLNSRSFKTNIDSQFLNSLLTCRHFNMSLMYSTQGFKLTDALLRSVTREVISCSKDWRFVTLKYYDAEELEYASNPSMVQPLRRSGYFVHNKDFKLYDTLATVENLKKAVFDGDMLSEAEIIALRNSLNPDNDSIVHQSKRLRRRRKRA